MVESRDIRQQELARLLLQKAHQDLVLVEAATGIDAIADEIVGFHVQQTVEKCIKAVLTRLGVQYEYTHDLSLLYQQVEDTGVNLPSTLDAVEALGPFAVQFRYTLHTTLDFDREEGAKLANEFFEWARILVEAPAG